MAVNLVVLAILAVLTTLAAPLTADLRRRLVARRFDAVYERNLLRRTGRG
jgi:type II secretory pathway pseudopilin PulG